LPSSDMQEKKSKRSAILLVALTCMTLVVYWVSKNDGVVDVDKNRFKNYDLKSIDQVVLESKKGRVELKFNGSKWEVNNQFDADPSMVEVLFATLQQAEPKRPLAIAMQDSITNALKIEGIKVTLVSLGIPKSSFYAGGNVQKTQAFFCETNGDMEAYLVTIPGYRVYVSGIFELPEKEWKNKYVFGFNWRNFQRLESKFPQKPSNNFEVSFQDNFFVLPGVSKLDTAKLNDFLDDVSLLTVDEYKDENIFPDSLSKPLPFIMLMVKDIGEHMYTLELYPPSQKGQPIPGLINGVQWAIFDPAKIQNVFKPKAFF
jgi:hypothetical protein